MENELRTVIQLSSDISTKPFTEVTAILRDIGVNTDLRLGTTPLAIANCGPDLVAWLIDNEADIEAPNYFGDRPLTRHSGRFANPLSTRALLDRGADPDAENLVGRTAAHAAASTFAAGPLAALAEHDANLNIFDLFGITPFSLTLRTASYLDLDRLPPILNLLLENGVPLPEDGGVHVERLGRDFEAIRPRFAKSRRQAASDALDMLYRLFDVQPVPPMSEPPAKAKRTAQRTIDAQFRSIWSESVPDFGPCDDLRAEAVRVVGRIGNEILNNGSVNWDEGFERMRAAVVVYFSVGTPLPPINGHDSASNVARALEGGGFYPKEIDLLTRYAVEWNQVNTSPITVPRLPYAR